MNKLFLGVLLVLLLVSPVLAYDEEEAVTNNTFVVTSYYNYTQNNNGASSASSFTLWSTEISNLRDIAYWSWSSPVHAGTGDWENCWVNNYDTDNATHSGTVTITNQTNATVGTATLTVQISYYYDGVWPFGHYDPDHISAVLTNWNVNLSAYSGQYALNVFGIDAINDFDPYCAYHWYLDTHTVDVVTWFSPPSVGDVDHMMFMGDGVTPTFAAVIGTYMTRSQNNFDQLIGVDYGSPHQLSVERNSSYSQVYVNTTVGGIPLEYLNDTSNSDIVNLSVWELPISVGVKEMGGTWHNYTFGGLSSITFKAIDTTTSSLLDQVTFTVYDVTEGMYHNGTTAEGEYEYDAYGDFDGNTFAFYATKTGYTASGTTITTVYSNFDYILYLTPVGADANNTLVNFRVFWRDAAGTDNMINNAVISINGVSVTTNYMGAAKVSVLNNATYLYTVTHPLYHTFTGNVTVTTGTKNVNVQMLPIGAITTGATPTTPPTPTTPLPGGMQEAWNQVWEQIGPTGMMFFAAVLIFIGMAIGGYYTGNFVGSMGGAGVGFVISLAMGLIAMWVFFAILAVFAIIIVGRWWGSSG